MIEFTTYTKSKIQNLLKTTQLFIKVTNTSNKTKEFVEYKSLEDSRWGKDKNHYYKFDNQSSEEEIFRSNSF